MGKIVSDTKEQLETPREPTAGGRIFKISLKGVPPVTPEMWVKMKISARTKTKGRRYPEIVDLDIERLSK